jgi:hypothetical protein
MKWAVGLTTVPSRVERTLRRSIDSLWEAGWKDPRVFLDGTSPFLPPWLTTKPMTVRSPGMNGFANWVMGLEELVFRFPDYDRYLMVQDDVLYCKGLREYLEQTPWIPGTYLNLILYPDNDIGKPHPGYVGWYPCNRNGQGAQALVFDVAAVETLLTHPVFYRRRLDRNLDNRGREMRTRNIDGGVSKAFEKMGYREYVHSPSLVDHIVEEPSVIGNLTQPKISAFPGEDFDCRTLRK